MQPQQRKEDILSLEEILAEGVEETDEGGAHRQTSTLGASPSPAPRLCKARMRALQQAAYYSAEHGYLDVTMELRAMGTHAVINSTHGNVWQGYRSRSGLFFYVGIASERMGRLS